MIPNSIGFVQVPPLIYCIPGEFFTGPKLVGPHLNQPVPGPQGRIPDLSKTYMKILSIDGIPEELNVHLKNFGKDASGVLVIFRELIGPTESGVLDHD